LALVWLTANPTTNQALAKIATLVEAKKSHFSMISAEELLNQSDQRRDKGGIGEEFQEIAKEGYERHSRR
jgi:hypothetical protein